VDGEQKPSEEMAKNTFSGRCNKESRRLRKVNRESASCMEGEKKAPTPAGSGRLDKQFQRGVAGKGRDCQSGSTMRKHQLPKVSPKLVTCKKYCFEQSEKGGSPPFFTEGGQENISKQHNGKERMRMPPVTGVLDAERGQANTQVILSETHVRTR